MAFRDASAAVSRVVAERSECKLDVVGALTGRGLVRLRPPKRRKIRKPIPSFGASILLTSSPR